MKRSRAVAVLAGAVLLAGCATRQEDGGAPASAGDKRAARERVEASGERPPVGVSASAKREAERGERVKMEPYRVQEGAFSDFGMAVKTNFEVVTGGNVTWMEVSELAPGGSAAVRGLAVGDRILALDGVAVTTLGRTAMLEALFQRKKGEMMRALVMGQRDAFPRFVVLVAGRTW